MSIYDAIANPMVPNIAQAVMQGTQLRQSQDKASRDAEMFGLEKRVAEQTVEKNQRALDKPEQVDHVAALGQVRAQATLGQHALSRMDSTPEAQRPSLWPQVRQELVGIYGENAGIPEEYDPEQIAEINRGFVRLNTSLDDFSAAQVAADDLARSGNKAAADAMRRKAEESLNPERRPVVAASRLVHPDGVTTVAVTNQAEYDALVNVGWQPIGTRQQSETGQPGDFSSPTDEREFKNMEAATMSVVTGVNRLREQLNADGASIVGVMGTAHRVLDSFAQQMAAAAAAAGGTAMIGDRAVPESQLTDASRYASEISNAFGATAARSAAFRSNVVKLAYALARSYDPGGRLSDYDIKIQIQRMAADGGSPTQIAAALDEILAGTLDDFRNQATVRGRPIPEWATMDTRGMRETPSTPASTGDSYDALRRRVLDGR